MGLVHGNFSKTLVRRHSSDYSLSLKTNSIQQIFFFIFMVAFIELNFFTFTLLTGIQIYFKVILFCLHLLNCYLLFHSVLTVVLQISSTKTIY